MRETALTRKPKTAWHRARYCPGLLAQIAPRFEHCKKCAHEQSKTDRGPPQGRKRSADEARRSHSASRSRAPRPLPWCCTCGGLGRGTPLAWGHGAARAVGLAEVPP